MNKERKIEIECESKDGRKGERVREIERMGDRKSVV